MIIKTIMTIIIFTFHFEQHHFLMSAYLIKRRRNESHVLSQLFQYRLHFDFFDFLNSI